MDLVPQVIEGEQAVEEHQHAVGDIEVVLGALADFFKLANDVVGEVSNGSPGKRRPAFVLRHAVLAQQRLERRENISGAPFHTRRANSAQCAPFVAVMRSVTLVASTSAILPAPSRFNAA